VLLKPVELAGRAEEPMAVLLLPVEFLSALAPIPVLSVPVALNKRTLTPTAVLLPPVLLESSAFVP